MSYDLFLTPRQGYLDPQAVVKWLDSRPNYQTNAGEAIYQNEDTGVYFTYSIGAAASPPDALTAGVFATEPDDPELPISFNMNYFRPSFFALEAEPEVAALVREFDLVIQDPQMDGMGEGDYNSEGFIRGWNTGNAFGYRVIINQHGSEQLPPFIMNREKLQKIWEWNYKREAGGNEHGGQLWLPRISFGMINDSFGTFAVWPDAIPSILPETDYIAIGRQAYAPRRLLILRSPDVTALPWQQVLPLLEKYGERQPDGTIKFPHQRPPCEVEDFLRTLTAEKPNLQLIPAGEILEKELVDYALENPGKPIELTGHDDQE